MLLNYSLPGTFIFIFIIQIIETSLADCPGLCECKWKSGKESVICLNANLSIIPLHLESSTQILDLTGNNIISIKNDEFSNAGLINLQKIYIAKCRLKSLERYSFKFIKNLVELDLSYNILTSIPSHTFDSIPELRELKLNGNPITRVSNNAFMHLPNLFRLELSNCRIHTIETKAFIGLENSLEWLKLDKNKLTEIDPNSFTILENLHGLELTGNNWNCSCNIRPLREWMLRQNIPFHIPPICYNPKRLFQKTWDKLDLDEYACVPEIFAYETNTHGVEGKNITMTCRITGIPKPNVKWLIKNKVIANLSGSTFSSAKKIYMVHLTNDSSNLTIFSADLQDAGTYICSAENKAGRAEASVTLAVSKVTQESSLSKKLFIISIVCGISLAIISFVFAIFVCTSTKNTFKFSKWRTRECKREDTYEKIELRQKTPSNINGDLNLRECSNDVLKKNGEYRVVPCNDTDQEEDEESTLEITTPGTSSGKKQWDEKLWNSPEHLLDQEDLHIPRRTLQESRDNIKKTYISSMSGTYSNSSSSTSGAPYWPHTSFQRQIPDVVNTLSNKKTIVSSRANSESGSVSDINELFCTLPRKPRYKSNDSQIPLLTDSNCGESFDFLKNSSVKYKVSNDSLNLNQEHNATPLLEISELESRVRPSNSGNHNNSYDFHAQQLEKFLEEYRSLQKQLTKMKETCDSLCNEKNMNISTSSTSTKNDIDNDNTPNSTKSIEDSVDFRNFENELTRYLLAKNPSPKNFNESVFPN